VRSSKVDIIAEGMSEEEYNSLVRSIATTVFTLEIEFWDMAMGNSDLYAM
jgi:thiaminase